MNRKQQQQAQPFAMSQESNISIEEHLNQEERQEKQKLQ